ncbi:hypothetical protein P4283_12745 [Bacillus thuringiensis]|nr:hypothetical protein [Bacillus thuringiensis]
MKTLGLVKKDHIQLINPSAELIEKVKDDKTQMTKFIMNLQLMNKEVKSVYQFFCEKNAKNNEISRIKFFEVNKFPDGIFICFNDDSSVDCYICELKATPSNKLEQLKEQLFSGYVHCKSLLAMLDVPLNVIRYRFMVFLVNDKNTMAEHNLNNFKKVIPGKPVVNMSDYELWRRNKAIYKNGEYVFSMDIEKYQMNNLVNPDEYVYEYHL